MHNIDGNAPVSFSDAMELAGSLLSKNKSSSWLGKKVYLAYNETEGWRVKELGLFDRALRGLNLAHRDTHLAKVMSAFYKLIPDEVDKISKNGLFEKMLTFRGKLIEGTSLPKATAPLSLVNYKASRCYTDSVMEVMLSQDSIRQKIFEAKKKYLSRSIMLKKRSEKLKC